MDGEIVPSLKNLCSSKPFPAKRLRYPKDTLQKIFANQCCQLANRVIYSWAVGAVVRSHSLTSSVADDASRLVEALMGLKTTSCA